MRASWLQGPRDVCGAGCAGSDDRWRHPRGLSRRRHHRDGDRRTGWRPSWLPVPAGRLGGLGRAGPYQGRRRQRRRQVASRRAATCEMLETLGVPMLGWRTDELPRFYSAHGGPPVSARVESADEVPGSPVPTGIWMAGASCSPAPRPVAGRCRAAIDEASPKPTGRDHRSAVTPFVLARLHERSDGRTLRANRDLIVANARLAGEIAAASAVQPFERGRGVGRDEVDVRGGRPERR